MFGAIEVVVTESDESTLVLPPGALNGLLPKVAVAPTGKPVSDPDEAADSVTVHTGVALPFMFTVTVPKLAGLPSETVTASGATTVTLFVFESVNVVVVTPETDPVAVTS